MPNPPKRSAQDVIDAAIRENRSWEWLSYILTILLALTGFTVLLVATFRSDGAASMSGVVIASLSLPALWSANGSRRENIRIRLYEIALAKATTSLEAAAIIREAMGRPPRPGGKTP